MAKPLERDELTRLALAALAQRDLSEAAIASHLAERAANPVDVPEVMQSLLQNGWVDDMRAARERTRVLQERGWSAARIEQELRSKEYAEGAISAALELLEPSTDGSRAAPDAQTLQHLIEQASATPTATLYRRLVARGFADDAVANALRAAGRQTGEASD